LDPGDSGQRVRKAAVAAERLDHPRRLAAFTDTTACRARPRHYQASRTRCPFTRKVGYGASR
ncbi:hypothetical protein ACWCQ0_49570, partial [Streptomyces massasporeus]